MCRRISAAARLRDGHRAMSRIVYVNGRYAPYAQSAVHVEDRGFQFADAIYEVIEVLGGALVDATRHLDRLDRSLKAVRMDAPMSRAALLHVIGETLRRNRVRDGLVYLQVSRGAAPRDFALPGDDTPCSLVVIARAQQKARIAAQAEQGIAVVSMPDPRWARCDIKTVMLLPAVLAKDDARRSGAKEVWFTDPDGHVTEGASSNAWIVTEAGTLVTHALDAKILPGVTRATAIDAARAAQIQVEERSFTLAEAYAAREAFITSATNTVMPVVMLDERPIGGGRPGSVTQRLRQLFHRSAETSTL